MPPVTEGWKENRRPKRRANEKDLAPESKPRKSRRGRGAGREGATRGLAYLKKLGGSREQGKVCQRHQRAGGESEFRGGKQIKNRVAGGLGVALFGAGRSRFLMIGAWIPCDGSCRKTSRLGSRKIGGRRLCSLGTYPPAGEAWDSDPVTLLASLMPPSERGKPRKLQPSVSLPSFPRGRVSTCCRHDGVVTGRQRHLGPLSISKTTSKCQMPDVKQWPQAMPAR